ncbi:MAG: 4Fe-4S double cluster binding domain-containing protein [Dehalococcoidia bacterium]
MAESRQLVVVDERTRKRFQADPGRFFERAIKAHVLNSPLNRLEAFDGDPIFEKPLVGFADGDDPIFDEFRAAVADFHMTPRDVLAKHLRETSAGRLKDSAPVSVISWVLPFDRGIRRSNGKETQGPSLRWNHGRWHGQDVTTELSGYVVSLLEDMGHRAVAPELSPFFEMRELPNGLASTWSQRHVAYAAGLGTFGLSDGFITPRGLAIRCGSVVTDLELTPSPRPYAHHQANCRFYADGSCGRCIQRCPGGAISEAGHDKKRCLTVLIVEQKPWRDGAHGEGYIGTYAGCGLCQTGVPCEHRIPSRSKRKHTS